MLSRKAIIKLFAEKPDRFGQVAGTVMTAAAIEELKRIPDLGLCEIAAFSDQNTLCEALKARRPKAVVPTICYRGTEYGQWDTMGASIVHFKKLAEKELGIFVAEPVILGSPKFWWALNGRFCSELRERFGFYSPCCGCRVYAFALHVPIYKALNARFIVANGGCRWDCRAAAHASEQARRYYQTLMSSFGVDLLYAGALPHIQGRHQGPRDPLATGDFANQLECIFKDNSSAGNGPVNIPGGLARYFESFAIPAAAKIISRALGDHQPDYLQEAADTLYPAARQTKKKRGRGAVS